MRRRPADAAGTPYGEEGAVFQSMIPSPRGKGFTKKERTKVRSFLYTYFLSQQAFFAAVVDAVLRDLGDQRPVQAPEEGQRYRQRG